MPYKDWILKRVFGVGAFLFLTFLFASCSWGDDFLVPSRRALITGYDLSQYVPVPVAGTYPSAGQSYPGVSVVVEWSEIERSVRSEDGETEKPVEGMFGLGRIYKAHIILEVTDTYQYYFNETKSFRYPDDLVAEQFSPPESDLHPYKREVIVIFSSLRFQASPGMEQKVLEYNLQRYVPVPVAGAIPVRSLEQPHFNIGVIWTPDVSVFTEGGEYQADITLEAKGGYLFDQDFPFRYPEGTVRPSSSQDNLDSFLRQIHVEYYETDAPELVSEVNLALHIPRPRIGQEPKYTLIGIGYMGVVEWKNGESEVSLLNGFEKETEYLAEVSIYADVGYTLAGSSITYSDTGGTLPVNIISSSSACVNTEITFLSTGKGERIPAPLNLTKLVPRPAIGATPVVNFFAGTYRGTVEWEFYEYEDDSWKPMVKGEIFKPETEYRAVVTLIPVAGCYFDSSIAVNHTSTDIKVPDFTDSDGDRTGTITFPSTPEGLKVDSPLDLTGFIPRPATRTAPLLSFSEGTYTGTVKWKKEKDGNLEDMTTPTFEVDTSYTAVVTLTPAEGYLFRGDPITVKYAGITIPGFFIEGEVKGTRTGSIEFPPTNWSTEIPDSLDLTASIPKPVIGATPVVSFSRGTYNGTVVWTETGKTGAVAVFQPKTGYTAKVTLTPLKEAGYSFSNGPVTVTHANADPDTPIEEFKDELSKGIRTGNIVFEKTEPGTMIEDTSFDLTASIPQPVTGGTPTSGFLGEGGKYRGAVEWDFYENGNLKSMGKGEIFKPETEYRAMVTLTPMPGYIFPISVKVTYDDALLTNIQVLPDKVTGTIATFPPTAEGLKVDKIPDLVGLIPKPIIGAVPLVRFSGGEYTGAVEWEVQKGGIWKPMEKDENFERKTPYKATVTLTPVPGYLFPTSVPMTYDGKALTDVQVSDDKRTVMVTITFSSTGDGLMVSGSFDLTSFISQPVIGATPVVSFTGIGGTWNGTVVWKIGNIDMPKGTTFLPKTTYRAEITLTPVLGYHFPDSVPMTYGGAALENIQGSSDKVTGTITSFLQTASGTMIEDTSFDLTDFIPQPIIGATPVLSFFGGKYRGAVEWKIGNTDMPKGTTFLPNKTYTAVVTLTPVPGYVFLNDPVTAKYTGMTDMAFTDELKDGTRKGNIEFPPTALGTVISSTSFDLTGFIPQPAIGVSPILSFSGGTWIGTVKWKTGNTDMKTPTFQSETDYTADVTLTPVPGYVFPGGSITVKYTGMTDMTFTDELKDGTRKGDITFAKTGEGSIKLSPPLDLTGFIPQPATGTTPVLSFTAGTYTGIVEWEFKKIDNTWEVMANGLPFQVNTNYKAKVTLTPVAGYSFPSGSVTVTYSGIGAIPAFTVLGNGRTGSIEFEQTSSSKEITGPLDLKGFIPQPATGATPVLSFSGGTYTGTVAWKEKISDLPMTTPTFEPGILYTAVVTLTPVKAAGYSFGNGSVTVNYTGTTVKGFGFLADGTRTGSIEFQTPTSKGTEITGTLNLAFIPKPAIGAAPIGSFTGVGYTGTVEWIERDTQKDMITPIFYPSIAYTAKVTLTPVAGYYFPDAVTVTHANASPSSISFVEDVPPNGTRKGNINFERIGEASKELGDLNLTYLIPKPETGNAPVGSFTGVGYTGTVAWKVGQTSMKTPTFQLETDYTAVVTLTPQAGYSFPSGSFTTVNHDDKDTTIAPFEVLGNGRMGSIKFPTTGKAEIGSINLTGFISKPIIGAFPVRSFSGGTWTGAVKWKIGTTDMTTPTFQPDKIYTAEVTLSPAAGYVFSPSVAVTYNGNGEGTVTKNFTGSTTARTGEITFGNTGTVEIGSINLTGFISKPVTGASPILSFSGGTWTGEVKWKEKDGNNNLDDMTTPTFQPQTVYTAEVTLSPVAGYSFPSGSVPVTYTGMSITNFTGSGDDRTGSIEFLTTGTVKISSINLTGFIPEPAIGAFPVRSFSGGTWTGTVAWKVGTTQTSMTTPTFQPQTDYTAVVTLSPADGYDFFDPFTVTRDGKNESVVGSGNIRTVSLPFGNIGTVEIGSINLTGFIPQPVTGAFPVGSFSGGTWTGEVEWRQESNKAPMTTPIFQPGISYTARVTLKPATADGYVFSTPVSVTYSGEGRVTVNFTGSSTTQTGDITFEKIDPVTISSINLTNLISPPAIGGTPALGFSGATCTGTVVWKIGGTEIPRGAPFQPNKIYTAVVTLHSAAGYVFSDPVEVKYEGSTVTNLTSSDTTQTVSINFLSTDTVTISSINLTSFIPKPAIGGTPVLDFSGGTWNGTVVWKIGNIDMLKGTTFQPKTTYTADVTLTPVAGYVFSSPVTVRYEGTDRIAASLGDKRTVSITFGTTGEVEIGSIDLTGSISQPAIGALPVRNFSGGTWNATVDWKEGAAKANMKTPTFQPETEYTAEVTLVPAPGYVFSASVSVTYSGSGVAGSQPFTGSNKNQMGSITFNKPAEVEIGSINLTSFIPQPAIGAFPVLTFSGETYTGTVDWKIGNTYILKGATFQPETKYTAEVTLTPATGYSFSGSVAVTHTDTEMAIPSFTGSPKRKGSITFMETGSIGVSDLDLAPYISMPVFGMVPETYKEAAQYTIDITWNPSGSTFTYFNTYTAEVTLTAKKGYIFTGNFSYTGLSPADLESQKIVSGTNGKKFSLNIKFPPNTSTVDLPFSGLASGKNSVIDVIKEAKDETTPLQLTLQERTQEYVQIGSTWDVSERGLVLTKGVTSPAEVTIDGGERIIALTGENEPINDNGTWVYVPLITVGNGVKLTLKNITFMGMVNNSSPLIIVEDGGELIMESGTKISDNSTTVERPYIKVDEAFTPLPAGVYIKEGAKATMRPGAVITRNRGIWAGGVAVEYGTFTMEGGEISLNESATSGGGVLVNEGTFTMKGGSIRGNKSLANYNTGDFRGLISGVKHGGGGVWVLGTFKMDGGTIESNVARKDFSDTIPGNFEGGYGGGVFISGVYCFPLSQEYSPISSTFTKTNGVITGNISAIEEDLANNGQVYATVWGCEGASGIDTTKDQKAPAVPGDLTLEYRVETDEDYGGKTIVTKIIVSGAFKPVPAITLPPPP